MYYLLRKARGMRPPKGDAKESVGVSGGTNADTAYVGRWKADAPETIGKVDGGNV